MADSLRQSIGAALGGFGAGVAGQGAQFLQQQSNRKLLDEKQVRQARAKDLIQARGFLQRGDTAGAADVFQNRVDVLDQNGMDSSNSKNALSAILTAQTTDDLNNVMGHFNDDLLDLVNDETISGEGLGLGTAKGGLASAKTEILSNGTVVQALPNGTVDVRDSSGNLLQGNDRAKAIAASSELDITQKQKEADIAINKAQKVANASHRAQRTSTVTQEMSGRKRVAGRGLVTLNRAANLVDRASQGLVGAVKVKLAQIFPGIDVSDETQLDQAMTQLALDELQKFKGPTTDFEFGVTQNIAGSLGGGQSANKAKINALKRANWFVQRESDQFNRHIDSGGDPDRFSFNFSEPMNTKKGVFTLQDLQDTAVNGNISIDEVLKRLNE